MTGKSAVWLHVTRINDRQVQCNRCRRTFDHKVGGSTSSLRTHVEKQHNIAVPRVGGAIGEAANKRRRSSSGGSGRGSQDDGDAMFEEDEDGNLVSLETLRARSQSSPPLSPTPSLPGSRSSTPSTSSAGIGMDMEPPPPRPASAPLHRSKSTTSAPKQQFRPLERLIEQQESYKKGGQRDCECTDALLFMLTQDDMPLCTTERKGMKVFIRVLNKSYKPPSEPTVTKLLKCKYDKLKQKVASQLAEASTIVLTTDIWTQKNTIRSYLGVTAHYAVGPLMVSVEIGAERLTQKKTIPYLRTVLRKICDSWKIKNESVKGVCTDGGNNIKGAAKEEFPHRHISCVGHLLDNVGQKVVKPAKQKTVPSEVELAAPEVEVIPENESDLEDEEDDGIDDEWDDIIDNSSLVDIVKKLKKTVKFFRQSEVASSELTRLQMEELNRLESQVLKLIQEVKTRWNSLFAMIDRYLELSSFVNRAILKVTMDKSSKSKPPPLMSPDEIEALTEVRDLLRPLDIATRQVSKAKFPTLSTCIPLIKSLYTNVEKAVAATPVGFNLKADLLKQLDRTFGKLEGLRMYSFATILDPRYKKVGFRDRRCGENAASGVADLVKRHIRRNQPSEDDRRAMETAASEAAALNPEDAFWSDLDSATRQAINNHAATLNPDFGYVDEFSAYLNTPPMDRKTNPNPLEAWESLKTKYPNVYAVAMDFIPLLGSSIPCERLFSHAGLIFTFKRSRLSPKNLNMLIFLRSMSEESWFSVPLTKYDITHHE